MRFLADTCRFAGSDTTAISLRSLFYYLCKNPRTYDKVVDEILSFDARGELSEYVTYHEGQRLSYFQACVREALRMHPAVGQLLERVVPSEGTTIDGVFLPGGTIVGMNPWVAARDKAVYGSDPEVFRPERWIEADEKTLKLMDRNWLAVSRPPFQSLVVADHYSLVLVLGRVWEKTSRLWRSPNWPPSCSGDTTSNWRTLRRSGSCTITGLSSRKACGAS